MSFPNPTKFIMKYPDTFQVDYVINQHMEGNKGLVDRVNAANQWNALYNALSKELPTEVLHISQKNTPDAVFTANAGFYNRLKNTFFLSNFSNLERKPEENYWFNTFSTQKYKLIFPAEPFEGEGDCLYLRTSKTEYFLICGFGSRTSNDFYRKNGFWPKFIGDEECLYLKLSDPYFYHLDTCFAPIVSDDQYGLVWYPDAFSSPNFIREFLIRKNMFNIEVSKEEALAFCCNLINVNNKVFMPKCSTVKHELVSMGVEVHSFEMSEFMKSGGACKCLVLTL